MHEVLGRKLKLGDLVYRNDSFSLVIGENELYAGIHSKKKLHKVIKCDNDTSVMLITNLDKEEQEMYELLKNDYQIYVNLSRTKLEIGNLYRLVGTRYQNGISLYLGEGIVKTNIIPNDSHYVNYTKEENGYIFLYFPDFCVSQTYILQNNSIGIQKLLDESRNMFGSTPEVFVYKNMKTLSHMEYVSTLNSYMLSDYFINIPGRYKEILCDGIKQIHIKINDSK